MWLDALYAKARVNHRIVSVAVVIAIGVRAGGERTILGLASGAAETEAFWSEFLRDLVHRGLRGVQLVISDAHEGLKNALNQVLTGATWQRCRVHFCVICWHTFRKPTKRKWPLWWARCSPNLIATRLAST